MKRLKNRITLVNVISSMILQIINIITYFIVPKIILSYFGSNVNGLVSSITQFLGYITLIEGGIGGVIMANLYKPIVEKDEKKLSQVIKTSQDFYKKIGVIFIGYACLVSLIYPIAFKTGFSYVYVCSLSMILSISLLIQYMYSSTMRNLLNADKKGYIVSLTQSAVLVLTIILSYISVKVYPSVHLLKFISGALFILQPLVYRSYIRKNYKIDNNAENDKNLLKQRWNGLAINIAAFIHFSTDIALLTIFTDLATVSVYSVYSTVTNGIRTIIRTISSTISYTVGNVYAKGNEKEINDKFDLYEFINFNIVFFLFSITGLLITPFVMIYTKGITDVSYNQNLFGILLVISEAIYMIQLPYTNLAYIANEFKKLSIPAFIEATINIVVSLILINVFGLIGVAIGTICGMTFRTVFQVYFSKNIIKNRRQSKFYIRLMIYIISTIVGIIIANLLTVNPIVSIKDWILHAIIYVLIFGVIYLLVAIICFRKEMKFLKHYIRRGK